MSNQRHRTAHRWRLLITITLGTFLAFGSLWLLQVMQREDLPGGADPSKGEPDYIVENFSFVRMTPAGKPRYLFKGAKLTHRPLGDVSDVERPIMQNMAPGQQPMKISALRGRIRHEQNEVDLLGKVDVVRPASPGAQYTRLKTEALTIFTDEDRMTSDRKVEMTLGAATATGTGMAANNATRQLDMKGRGQLVLPPAVSRATPN